MHFTRIDANSDEKFDAWFGVLQRSERSRDGESGQGWHPDEWRARSIDETAPRVFHLYSYGPTAERPVAVGALEVTRDDNLAFIEGNLFVDPAERRRGYGSTLLQELEAAARDLRRPTLVIFVIEGSREIGSGPNRSFAAGHGYRIAEEHVRRDLEWPRPSGELDHLSGAGRERKLLHGLRDLDRGRDRALGALTEIVRLQPEERVFMHSLKAKK